MPMAPAPEAATVTLQYMVTDLETASSGSTEEKILEGFRYKSADPLLNGPVSRRVAVVDIDPETGKVVLGARFLPPSKGRKIGRYSIKNPNDFRAKDFQQVSVFGAVLKTMAMFEESDVLGRPLKWAFDGEQLLVVPRAGRMANAFYHRGSRSLQFFFFDTMVAGAKTTVFTCLSPDIIAHEATHAILDGIAPDLYDAISPQSLALHEAIADLAAVIFALRTSALRDRVLKLSNGDLKRAGAFNEIAKQFGTALAGADEALRNLYNEASLSPHWGKQVRREPHDLSTVLSGALYRLLVADHDKVKTAIVDALDPQPANREEALYSASGKALFISGEKFKRIVFRALDYLPPGEISFADYGRALIAADMASNPERSWERDLIKEEFVRRGIVDDPSELETSPPAFPIPQQLDLSVLVRSDWAAYQFAEAHRAELRIPATLPFDVRPRLDVTKTTFRSELGLVSARECIFKVAWQETQLVAGLGGLAKEVGVTRGTTIAIDWTTKSVKALLSTSSESDSQATNAARADAEMRESYLKQCLKDDVINPDDIEVQGTTLRVRGLGQLLHLTGR